MARIRAAVCHAFGAPLVVEEVELRAPADREVEVTLSATAICHSDISYADGGWGGPLPAVYGHEAAGHVHAVGEGVDGYAPGDPVLVTLLRACGRCPACAAGRPVTCTATVPSEGPLRTLDDNPIEQGLQTAAFAERVVVDQSQLAPIPSDVPMESASLLSCGVITGVGAAVNTVAIRPGETVVVIGAGGVGLNAIQGARLAGAARIVAVDLTAEKCAIARAFGATDTLLGSGPAPSDALEATLGRRADVVLVTVGLSKVYTDAPRYLAPGGRVVMVGMPHTGTTADYDPGGLAAYSQGLLGSRMGDTVLARDIPWMVDLYRQGRLELDALISGRWSLDQINEAIADTRSGAARRNVILFH